MKKSFVVLSAFLLLNVSNTRIVHGKNNAVTPTTYEIIDHGQADFWGVGKLVDQAKNWTVQNVDESVKASKVFINDLVHKNKNNAPKEKNQDGLIRREIEGAHAEYQTQNVDHEEDKSILDLGGILLKKGYEKISGTIDSILNKAKKYFEDFQKQAENYFSVATEKKSVFRKEIEEKLNKYVTEFMVKQMNAKNHNPECKERMKIEFESEINATLSKVNECIDEIIESHSQKYKELLNLASEYVERLANFKEEASECSGDDDDSSAWAIIKCVNSIGFAAADVAKGFVELKETFVNFSMTLAALPARQAICYGNEMYEVVKYQLKHAEERLAQCDYALGV